MKTEELRIGNWLCINGENRQVHSLATNEIDAIGYKNARCEWTFEPIPLTEQWLKDFGFKKTRLDGYLIPLSRKGHEFTYSLYWDKGTVYTGDSAHYGCFQFKYVHQLQNLYFALTGKELEKK